MATTSKISKDVEITGVIQFRGELIIEGKFTGQSIEGHDLVVGEHAEVHSKTITVNNLTSSGLVEGEADVAQRCHLKSTAHLQGGLNTFRLAMDDGATFSGKLLISKPPNIAHQESQKQPNLGAA